MISVIRSDSWLVEGFLLNRGFLLPLAVVFVCLGLFSFSLLVSISLTCSFFSLNMVSRLSFLLFLRSALSFSCVSFLLFSHFNGFFWPFFLHISLSDFSFSCLSLSHFSASNFSPFSLSVFSCSCLSFSLSSASYFLLF